MKRVAIVLLAAFFWPGAPAFSQEPYFPLEPGNLWTYVLEKRPESEPRFVGVFITGLEDLYHVDFFGLWEARINAGPGGNDLDIVLEREGLVPYYRFNEDSFLHRDVIDCRDGTVLTAAARDETVETPAGVFTGCLRLDFEPGPCVDAGTISEWWKVGVGRVKWVERTFGGPWSWVLRSFEPGAVAPYRRGDCNGDGQVAGTVSDAVFLLNFNFLGGAEPSCLASCDADGDGQVRGVVTDAVYLLNFNFLGGAPPASPFPDCGFSFDPDDIALGCEGPAGCP